MAKKNDAARVSEAIATLAIAISKIKEFDLSKQKEDYHLGPRYE